jgi:hypothetical protein
MNRIANGSWVRCAIALAALSASLPGMARDEHAAPCALASLNGLYVFSASGFTMPEGTAEPKAITEMIRFNGDGTLNVLAATHSINGVVARSAPSAGTYSLDNTCVGTLQFTGGPGFDIFVAPKASRFWMIQTDQNNVLEGEVARISQ